MTGSNRNLRLQDSLFRYLKEDGPKTVSELTDYLNNYHEREVGRRIPKDRNQQPKLCSRCGMPDSNKVSCRSTLNKDGTWDQKHTKRTQKAINNYSSRQITGVLRTSPLFKVDGKTKVYYPAWSRLPVGAGSIARVPKQELVPSTTNTCAAIVNVWSIVPVKEVVDNMVTKETKIRRWQPSIIKNEFKRRGLDIANY